MFDELRERIAVSKYDSGLDGWWAGRVEKALDRIEELERLWERRIAESREKNESIVELERVVAAQRVLIADKNTRLAAQSAHQEVKE